ncbi:MAG: hypothetical protein CVV42_19565 [Candidatus Riflebacteria bacterium HGW-Riflebacteria-2]|jgi:hypothetical protein|nr:MAG: hypothetical protein CVV42_19565 [Candidatus Riflebacteria bacterium HGW-Riflebacteria-2]
MPHFGKRNLLMLLTIKIFVIGLLLVGCQEGTNKSPVSTLLTGLDMTQATVDLTSLGDDVAKHTITGTVVSQNTGEKLANITVSLMYENQLAATTKTTSDGQFYFTKVPAGLFDLAFASPDNTYASTTYILRVLDDGTTSPAAPEVKMVALNPGQIQISTEIKGEVINSTGEKLANINVALKLSGDTISTALTNSLGQFSFANLSPGSYTLTVGESSNYITQNPIVDIRNNGVVLPRYSIISLQEIDITKTYTITGYVKSQNKEAIANIEVHIFSDREGKSELTNYSPVYTTGEGKFFFQGLTSPGMYFLKADKTDNTEDSAIYPVNIFADGTTSPLISDILVTRQESLSTASFSGKIYDAFTGGPLEYATVKVGDISSSITDRNGEFFVTDMLPGSYKLDVSKSGYEILSVSFQVLASGTNDFRTIPTSLSYPLLHDMRSGYGSIAGRLLEITTGNGRTNKFVQAFNWVETTKEYIDAKGNIQTITDWEILGGPILTTKTSIEGSEEIPDLAGSFKLTHLAPGRYALGFFEDENYKLKDEIREHGVKWQVIDNTTVGYIGEIRNLSVEAERTTYWTNYEQEYK